MFSALQKSWQCSCKVQTLLQSSSLNLWTKMSSDLILRLGSASGSSFGTALPICSFLFSLESWGYTGDSNLLQWASKIQIQQKGGMCLAKKSCAKAPSNISLPKKNFGTPHLAPCWSISAARGVFHVLINYLQEAFSKLCCHLSPWIHHTEICILVTCPHLSQWQLLSSAVLPLCIPIRLVISA